MGSPDAPDGSSASWTFDAPPGTVVTRWRYSRYLGKYSDDDWEVFGKLDDGTVFDTCSIPVAGDRCSVGAPGFGTTGAYRDLSGIAANRIVFGFICRAAGATCITGATIHRVWASLYSSIVTLTENTPPSVGSPSGTLLGDGWKQGTQQVSFTAGDGSPGVGIKETRVYVDGISRSSVARSCDYTFTVPCTDPASAVINSIDTTAIPDGEWPLEVAAIDAAGNERRGAPVTVRVDNNAPGSLAITASANFTGQIAVAWSSGDAGGSGVQDYDVEVAVDGGPFSPWLTGTSQTSASYPSSPGRTYAFRMRARDRAGHTSANVTSGQVTAPSPAGPGPTAPEPPASGGSPAPDPDGSPPPDAGDPTTTPRASPSLRLHRPRLADGRLRVSGVLPSAATGHVTISYRARLGRHVRRLRRSAPVRAGRFRAVLPLPRRLAPRATLTVRYSGDARYRPRTLRLPLSR